ncbi:hypothetical protein Pelo_236 [Pelomyxa schiedti]|nr:hypothetical protein Pelo_236 [Pelomyxa schiedti]
MVGPLVLSFSSSNVFHRLKLKPFQNCSSVTWDLITGMMEPQRNNKVWMAWHTVDLASLLLPLTDTLVVCSALPLPTPHTHT